VEELNRAKGVKKGDVPFLEFRQQCRDYAAHWVGVQREQLQRLGIWGDWDNPYLTMDFAAEATIANELMKFAESGQVYRGAKPVMWSPVEQTALAEAEAKGIHGPATTPFLLEKVANITKGRSMAANLSLLKNNARIAGKIAKALSEI